MKRHIALFTSILFISILHGCGNPKAEEPLPPDELSVVVKLPAGELPAENHTAPTKPDRWHADTTLEIIPSGMYGEIYPYIGGLVIEGHYYIIENLYGFCDKNGRIVCDPVYNDVKRIDRGGKKLYAAAKNRLGPDRANLSTTTLAAFDGSWAETYDGIFYEHKRDIEFFKEFEYDYITAKNDGKWGIIDFEGQEVLPFAYEHPLFFADGLAPLISEDKKTYGYINPKGEIVSEIIKIEESFWFDDEFYPEYEYPYFSIMNSIDDYTEYNYIIEDLGNGYYAETDYANDTVTITHSAKTHIFENAEYISLLPPDRFLLARHCDDGIKWRIEDFDGSLISSEINGYSRVIGNYILANDKVYDFSGNRIGNEEFIELEQFGNCFTAKQGYYGGLVDKNLNWIIKVSLLDYYND